MSGDSNGLEQLTQHVKNVSTFVENMNIDYEQYQGQEVDEEVVAWYKKRFDMFAEDKCLGATVEYLKKMRERTDINDVTKLAVGMLTLQ